MPGRSVGSVLDEMTVRRRHRVRRTLVLVTVAVAAAACGGPEQPATDPLPADTAVEAVDGSELAGVRFDVRRDPG